MEKTQTNDVLKHLKEHGEITSMEGIKRFGATRLSDIIMRLRKHYIIETEIVESPTPNKYGKKSRYGIYHYKGEKKQHSLEQPIGTNTNSWVWLYFEDGYRCPCRGMDEVELAAEERKHGKLIKCVIEN